MITVLPGAISIKPRSATLRYFTNIAADIVDRASDTVYNNLERFKKTYWGLIPFLE
jgi:hypothetical protein